MNPDWIQLSYRVKEWIIFLISPRKERSLHYSHMATDSNSVKKSQVTQQWSYCGVSGRRSLKTLTWAVREKIPSWYMWVTWWWEHPAHRCGSSWQIFLRRSLLIVCQHSCRLTSLFSQKHEKFVDSLIFKLELNIIIKLYVRLATDFQVLSSTLYFLAESKCFLKRKIIKLWFRDITC